MRAQINPPRVTEIKEGSEELRKAMLEWKKLDSSVLLGVLDGLKTTLLEPLRSMSFETGVKYVTGMNNLTFNPVLDKASYYQPVEGKPDVHRSSVDVSPFGQKRHNFAYSGFSARRTNCDTLCTYSIDRSLRDVSSLN